MKPTSRARRNTSVTLAVLALGAMLVGVPGASSAVTPPLAFTSFAAPGTTGAGEPTLGVSWKSGAVMYVNGTRVYKVSGFNHSTRRSTWTDVTPPGSIVSLDPILFADHRTSRTFVSQLTVDCSYLAFTDDDGSNWTVNPVGCGLANGPDHQTVGGGPFAAPLTGGTAVYPNAVYYCAQTLVFSSCSVSTNGGLSFNPALPVSKPTECSAIHGHIAVAPDGTAYLPFNDCPGNVPGVYASTDNGTTWTMRKLPGSDISDGDGDPGIAVGAKGTLYLGWPRSRIASDGFRTEPYVAVSRDRGVTWTNIKNTTPSTLGIRNIQFPTMIAGDDNRAAFAFLGSKVPGNDQLSSYKGIWHLYVSVTTDGGRTWTTTDVTPTDPVQRGFICMKGINCKGGRNLLDFMGMDIDRYGRIYVSYADGCIDFCVTNATWPSNKRHATIARQLSGPDLIAAR